MFVDVVVVDVVVFVGGVGYDYDVTVYDVFDGIVAVALAMFLLRWLLMLLLSRALLNVWLVL